MSLPGAENTLIVFIEWEQGKFECVGLADAAEVLADFKEVYRDFLDD
jgi:hypothetical protein